MNAYIIGGGAVLPLRSHGRVSGERMAPPSWRLRAVLAAQGDRLGPAHWSLSDSSPSLASLVSSSVWQLSPPAEEGSYHASGILKAAAVCFELARSAHTVNVGGSELVAAAA